MGSGHIIGSNHPFESDTIPIILLHKAFGIFSDRYWASPSKQVLDCVGRLSSVGCKWYNTETDQRKAFWTMIVDYMGLQLHAKKVLNTDWWKPLHHHDASSHLRMQEWKWSCSQPGYLILWTLSPGSVWSSPLLPQLQHMFSKHSDCRHRYVCQFIICSLVDDICRFTFGILWCHMGWVCEGWASHTYVWSVNTLKGWKGQIHDHI